MLLEAKGKKQRKTWVDATLEAKGPPRKGLTVKKKQQRHIEETELSGMGGKNRTRELLDCNVKARKTIRATWRLTQGLL